MIKKNIRLPIKFLCYYFSNKIFTGFHYFLLHLSQRALGYKNFGNFNKTGEKLFKKKLINIE